MKEKIFGLSDKEIKKEDIIIQESLIKIDNYKDFELLFNFSNIEILNKLQIQWVFLNMENMHKILYNLQEVISIAFNEKTNNIPYLFYLDYLIMDNPDYINYAYDYNFIINVNTIKPKNGLVKVIKGKIIIELIYNYKGLPFYEKDIYIKYLKGIKDENDRVIEDNISFFQSLNLNWNKTDILHKTIDKIYLGIIIVIISEGNFRDYNICNLLDELGLKSIIIIKEKYEELYNLVNNDDYFNKYKILTKDDLLNETKICFYYILLKYIFKSSIDIYQINLFLITKKVLIKLIKQNLLHSSSFKLNEKNEFIIKKIIDNDYYYNIFIQELKNNKQNDLSEIIHPEINHYLRIDNSEITVIDYIKKIKGDFVRELNNGYLIIYKGKKKTLKIYDHTYNQISSVNIDDGITDCYEINTNEETENKFILYSLNKLISCTIHKDNNITNESYELGEISCSIFFEVKKDCYLISGIKGCYLFNKLYNENNKILSTEKSYINGIKINEDIVALTSNNIYPGPEDELIFYNIGTGEIIQINKYSITPKSNSLVTYPKEQPKILLCPCSKKSDKQNNGILIIDLNIINTGCKERKELKKFLYFFDSKNIEVNCICILFNKQSTETEEISTTNKNGLERCINNAYFFAGGFDKDKNGIINLYKLTYTNYFEAEIVYIMKIEFETNNIFKGIKHPVTSIIQSKKKQNIFFTSGEYVYIFKKPNLKKVLEENEIWPLGKSYDDEKEESIHLYD